MDTVRPNVLILGVGNVLLRDEGVGVHAVRRLADRFDLPDYVSVVDGGTCGLDLIDVIAGCDHLIIVDAVAHGDAPGSIIRLADSDIPAFLQVKISPHQLGLSEVLAVLQLTDEVPRSLTLLGMQPSDMSLGLDLSECLADRVGALVDAVVAELGSLGLEATVRRGDVPERDRSAGRPETDLPLSQ